MDASLVTAHKELGRQQQDIREACASTPFAACMRRVIPACINPQISKLPTLLALDSWMVLYRSDCTDSCNDCAPVSLLIWTLVLVTVICCICIIRAHRPLGGPILDSPQASLSEGSLWNYAQAVATLATRGCDLVIVSDANLVYIDAILEHHGLKQHFKEVITDPTILSSYTAACCATHLCSVLCIILS